MSREEIEQVEKELDEVLEIVQRPVPVKNTGREETVSLQENLQENDPLQEEMQIETEKEEKEEKEDSPESAAKEQTAVSEEELDLEDDIENGYFHFLRPSDWPDRSLFRAGSCPDHPVCPERHLPFW